MFEKYSLKVIVATLGTFLGIVAAILAFDDRYATSEELKNTEIQLVQTLEKFKSDMVKDREQQRYINLTDQAMQLKILLRKTPNDTELREDYNKIEQERQEVKKRLEGTK